MGAPIGRRVFLARLGLGSVAVALLGPAACSTESRTGDTFAAPPSPEEVRSTQGSAAPGATSPGATSPETTAPGTTGPAAEETLSWERVSLGFVSAYVLRRGRRGVVVDTGVSGSEGAIEQGLASLDLAWADIDHVVLTHHHPDHVGSLGAVVELASAATVYAGEGDIPQISSPRPPVAVGDGDEVLGLLVVETPGHTPGSISVLDEASGVLVVGDALNGGDAVGGVAGTVAGANPDFSSDMAVAADTVRKLAALSFETALFGHGEPVLSGASDQVAQLASEL